ncbi:hypothetical protein F66182_5925 [Fusarium sp. NRRL 66182]|nr:hypothetical protein F66182_5925 [Fusarium sp. NRRL 66182]
MDTEVYSAESCIRRFFDTLTTATRAECDTKAASIVGGTVIPVPIQGVWSYTVTGGPGQTDIVQFRAEQSKLDMANVKMAKLVHTKDVPKCEYHGQIGEDFPLSIYVMEKRDGVCYIQTRDTSLEGKAEFEMRQFRTVGDLARFFAASWKGAQQVSSSIASNVQLEFESDLSRLSQRLPDRFTGTLNLVRRGLPRILTLPFVITHGDLNETNILVDNAGHISGVIDWAESKIYPFGISLWALENILGYMDSSGWHYYDNAKDLRDEFWRIFETDIGGLQEEVKENIRFARMIGLFLRYGFQQDGAVRGKVRDTGVALSFKHAIFIAKCSQDNTWRHQIHYVFMSNLHQLHVSQRASSITPTSQLLSAMTPPPNNRQPPNSTPSTSASRQRLARRACDSCKIRKIRCSETPPCTGCEASGITCTFNLMQRTRGPRGLRPRTLDKIERRRKGDVVQSTTSPDRSLATKSPSPVGEAAYLLDILEVYSERLFPIWPIVDATDLRNQIRQNPSQNGAARYLANAVALAAIAQLKLETAWQPSVEEAETSGLSETLGLLDALRISFFLHIYHENALPGGTKSLVYLREAITQAQILRLDRESTYASLSDADQHVSRRILWLLFVTERGVALLHKLPIVLKPNILFPWFGGADDQAEVLPAFLKLVHLFWVFDQSGIFEILHNVDADSDIPNMASVAQSCLELLQQKLLDSADNDDWGPINQVQRADMFVTRQWMRAVLWRAALRFGIVIPGMNPISIANDFLSLVSELPKAALESHGPTLEFKTFEIATAVIDAMASDHSIIPDDQSIQILHRLRDILSSCRGGNRTLLSLFTIKMDAISSSSRLLEASSRDAIVFEANHQAQASFQDTAELLTAQSNLAMPTYQFMEEQASQICWPPLDLGYLVRSPSPLTRMLLESMPREAAEQDQVLAS